MPKNMPSLGPVLIAAVIAAWLVYLYDGNTYASSKSVNALRGWPVRGGQ